MKLKQFALAFFVGFSALLLMGAAGLTYRGVFIGTTTNAFQGDGSGLTNIVAASTNSGLNFDSGFGTNIADNTLLQWDVTSGVATPLQTNIALLNGTNVFAGTNRFSGPVLLTNDNNTVSGNGAGLTNLVNGPTVSAGSGITVTPTENSDGSTNYAVAALAGAGGGDMLAANNLSDVASVSAARTNLSLAPGRGVALGTDQIHFAQASAYTAGAIPFAASTTEMGFDAANLFWDAANNLLGVGRVPTEHELEVQARTTVYRTNTPPVITFRRQDSATNIATLGTVHFNGTHDGGVTYGSGGATVNGEATENFGASANGAGLRLRTTPPGNTTRFDTLFLQSPTRAYWSSSTQTGYTNVFLNSGTPVTNTVTSGTYKIFGTNVATEFQGGTGHFTNILTLGGTTVSVVGHNHDGTYQPDDADLDSLAAGITGVVQGLGNGSGYQVAGNSAVLLATTASFTSADETKLDGIESAATADQSDAEIETAYNNQVAAASQAEMEAGTEAAIRRMSPLRVAQAIAALAGAGGGGGSSTNFIATINYSGTNFLIDVSALQVTNRVSCVVTQASGLLFTNIPTTYSLALTVDMIQDGTGGWNVVTNADVYNYIRPTSEITDLFVSTNASYTSMSKWINTGTNMAIIGMVSGVAP